MKTIILLLLSFLLLFSNFLFADIQTISNPLTSYLLDTFNNKIENYLKDIEAIKGRPEVEQNEIIYIEQIIDSYKNYSRFLFDEVALLETISKDTDKNFGQMIAASSTIQRFATEITYDLDRLRSAFGFIKDPAIVATMTQLREDIGIFQSHIETFSVELNRYFDDLNDVDGKILATIAGLAKAEKAKPQSKSST